VKICPPLKTECQACREGWYEGCITLTGRDATLEEIQWQFDFALRELKRQVLGVFYGPYERIVQPVTRWNARRLVRRYRRGRR
jgi:hypothetical protein